MAEKKYTQELLNNLKFIKQAVDDFVKEKKILEHKETLATFIRERQKELGLLVDQDLVPLKKKLLKEVNHLEIIVENFANTEIKRAKAFLAIPKEKLRHLQENIENISPCHPTTPKTINQNGKKKKKKVAAKSPHKKANPVTKKKKKVT